jgi:hypothetical protein
LFLWFFGFEGGESGVLEAIDATATLHPMTLDQSEGANIRKYRLSDGIKPVDEDCLGSDLPDIGHAASILHQGLDIASEHNPDGLDGAAVDPDDRLIDKQSQLSASTRTRLNSHCICH